MSGDGELLVLVEPSDDSNIFLSGFSSIKSQESRVRLNTTDIHVWMCLCFNLLL